jgi:hypothetical protein
MHELRREAHLKAAGVAQEAPNRAKHGLLITMIAAAYAPFCLSKFAVYLPAQRWLVLSADATAVLQTRTRAPAAGKPAPRKSEASPITSTTASLRSPLRGQLCATAISTDDRV